MSDQTHPLKGIDWHELLPFTHLFRAFRVAIHPSKLFLAAALLLGIYAGGRLLDGFWMAQHIAQAGDLNQFPSQNVEMPISGIPAVDGGMTTGISQGIFLTFLSHQIQQVNQVAMSVLGLDIRGIWKSVYDFLITGPAWLFREHPLFALLFSAWFLLLWSVLGGAIARIAAVHVARDEKISVRQALRFSTSKLLSFLFAPVIPLLILLGLGLLLAIGGLALYVPYLGSIAVGAFLGFGLAIGFIMTLVLLGTLGGFNLMFPTVAVEGSDSFDAISRSFSYVFTRPWKTLWYTFVAIVYGALTFLFVRLFITLMLGMTRFFIGWFLGHSPRAFWFGENVVVGQKPVNPMEVSMWPAQQFNSLPYSVDFAHLAWPEGLGAGLILFWVYLAITVLGAYAISYYFSANTIIYGLLRREVDATELDDVYLDQGDEDFGDIAGDITSSDQAEGTSTTAVSATGSTAASNSATSEARPAVASDVEPPPSVAGETKASGPGTASDDKPNTA